MIDGSEKCKRQLVFELQSLRVYEKRSKAGTQGYIEYPPPPPRGAQTQGHTFQFKCKEGKKQEMEYVAHITLL